MAESGKKDQSKPTDDFGSALQAAVDALGLQERYKECFGNTQAVGIADTKSLFASCAKWGWDVEVVDKEPDVFANATIYILHDPTSGKHAYLQASSQPKPMVPELTILDENDNEIEMVCGDELPSLVEVTETEFETSLQLGRDQLMYYIMNLLTADVANVAKNKDMWARLARQFADTIGNLEDIATQPFECLANKNLLPLINGTKKYVNIEEGDFPIDEEDETYIKRTTMDAVLSKFCMSSGPFKEYMHMSHEKEKVYTNSIDDNELPTKQWTSCKAGRGLLHHPEKSINVYIPEGSRVDVVGMVYAPGKQPAGGMTVFDVGAYLQSLAALTPGDRIVVVDATTGGQTQDTVAANEGGVVSTTKTSRKVHTKADEAWKNDCFVYRADDATDVFYRGLGATSDVAFVLGHADVPIEQAVHIALPTPDDVVVHHGDGLLNMGDVETLLEERGFDHRFARLTQEVVRDVLEANNRAAARPAPAIDGDNVKPAVKSKVSGFFTRTIHAMSKTLQSFGYRAFSKKGSWMDCDFARMKALTSHPDNGLIAYTLLVSHHLKAIMQHDIRGQSGGASDRCKGEELKIKKTYESHDALAADNMKTVEGIMPGDYARVKGLDDAVFRRFRTGDGVDVWVKDMTFNYKQCSKDDVISDYKHFIDRKCVYDEIERVCRMKAALVKENATRNETLARTMMSRAHWLKTHAVEITNQLNSDIDVVIQGTRVLRVDPVPPDVALETEDDEPDTADHSTGPKMVLDFNDVPFYHTLDPGAGSSAGATADDELIALLTRMSLQSVAGQVWAYIKPLHAMHIDIMKSNMDLVKGAVERDTSSARKQFEKEQISEEAFKTKLSSLEKASKRTLARLTKEETARYTLERATAATAVALLVAQLHGRTVGIDTVTPVLAAELRISPDRCKKDVIKFSEVFLADHADIANRLAEGSLVDIGLEAPHTNPWASFRPMKPGAMRTRVLKGSKKPFAFGKAFVSDASPVTDMFVDVAIALPHKQLPSLVSSVQVHACKNEMLEQALIQLQSPQENVSFWNRYSDAVSEEFADGFVVDMLGDNVERHRMLLLPFLKGELRHIVGGICNKPSKAKLGKDAGVALVTALNGVDACLRNIVPHSKSELVVLVYLDMFAEVLNAAGGRDSATGAMLQEGCLAYVKRNIYDADSAAADKERLREQSKNKKLKFLESIEDEDYKKELENLLRMGLTSWDEVLSGMPPDEEDGPDPVEPPKHTNEEAPDASYHGYFESDDEED